MRRHERQVAQPLTDGLGERRASLRFPIVRDVRYEMTSHRGEPKSGTGKTVDMSSGGVLFVVPEALDPGKQIKLSISWPAHLDGKYALKLLVWGQITRCQGTSVAVKIDSHEFRTRSSAGCKPA